MLEHVRQKLKALESKVAFVQVQPGEFTDVLDTLLHAVSLLHSAAFELPEGREKQNIESFLRAFELLELNVSHELE